MGDLNMHRTSEEVHNIQNESTNIGIEDSTSMTIEYLRARLLSERSESQATRERANELANRVAELEEQLRIASLQRKKAENATLDLLAILENHGIGEMSDEYDSGSGMEESFYEPNMDNGNSVKEEASSLDSKRKEGSSGSDHGRTSPIGRSLSWKIGNNSPHSRERNYNTSIYKRDNFVQSSASSRRRLGKSCRQMKRREVRSNFEKSMHESTSLDAQGSGNVDDSVHIINASDSKPEELRKSSEHNIEKALKNTQNIISSEAEGQVSGAINSVPKHTSDRESESSLQHQSRLIGRFEAEEKAQREWEEKYTRNGYNLPDSCEPGNQSDVTEERDDTKAFAPSPSEITPSNEKPISIGIRSSITHIDSFKFTATESSNNIKVNEVHSHRASTSDFAFPVIANETQVLTDNHLINAPVQSPLSQPQSRSPNTQNFSVNTPDTRSKEFAIVPHEGPQKLREVLDALQQAKQLLEQNISCLPLEESMFAHTAETSESAIRDIDRMKMVSGLFRVPNDFQFKAMSSGSSSHLIDYRYDSNAHLLHSMARRSPSTESRNSSSNPWYNTSLPFSSGFTNYPSNSIYPDVTRRLLNGESYIVQSPSRSSEVSASDYTAFDNDHNRPNRYIY